ncbi:MAG: hypothetical protein K9G24_00375 [Candidatus Nanopelagicales bacterium]|nr:hypothetical protein [Candidatus Nanopelagicales bacterium]MCF8536407.1 hypothetical protein [Candidatus Nanopelagicales bacterium]MCF8541512.1 hypothetical protein [Candidatus Nanopelagicales bacterium]
MERPIADVDRALLVGHSADEYLTSIMGFGVTDLAEVALSYADLAISRFVAAWPDAHSDDDGPQVTIGELAIAKDLIALGTPASLVRTEAMSRALDWVTSPTDTLPYDFRDPSSVFGRFLRTRETPGAEPRWMPLAFIPEALGQAVCELGAIASHDPMSCQRFASRAAGQAREALWRFSDVVAGSPDTAFGPAVSPLNRVQWVVPVGSTHAIAVQVVATLNGVLPFDDDPAVLAAVRESPGALPTRLTLAGGDSVTLDPQVELVPLLVIASPGHIAVPSRPGLPGMSLDDLRWAATTATADTDLYNYCRDLSRPGMPMLMGWEAINIWQWWIANGKAIHTQGAAPMGIVFAAHEGNAEWDRGARWSPIERDLATLGLPGLRDLDGLDEPEHAAVTAFHWKARATGSLLGVRATPVTPERRRPELVGWSLHPGPVPVAVSLFGPTWTRDVDSLLYDIAGAFTFGLRQIRETWNASHNGDESGYVLALANVERVDADIEVANVLIDDRAHGRVVHATLNIPVDSFTRAAAQDITVGRALMAAAMEMVVRSAGMKSDDCAAIRGAWSTAPPTLVVQVGAAVTARATLRSPLAVDESLASEIQRIMAESLKDGGVTPGTYQGVKAGALDREHLAPIALGILNDALDGYAMDDVIEFGMQQIERSLAKRRELESDIRRSSQHLAIEWDAVARHREVMHEHLLLRRSQEAAVEAALRLQPQGSRTLDDLSWQRILAAADAYMHATMRSEAVHHQLNPSAIEVSESYEISIAKDGSPTGESERSSASGNAYDLDIEALSAMRSQYQLADADEGMEAERVPGPGAIGLTDSNLDDAMLTAFGATGLDILTTLFALAAWPLGEDEPDAVPASLEDIVKYVRDETLLGELADGETRIRAALSLLTGNAAEFAADDWKPWHTRSRRRRLAVQPLATLSDDRIVVSPHACLGTLSVYMNYLRQGQLPWSQPKPPRAVEDAMDEIRDRRNKALEVDVVNALRSHGWTVIENVKEQTPHRLGLPVLRSEIDAVAGRTDARVIWLLEVKDPVDVFTTPEIRRTLDRFYDESDPARPPYATKLRQKLEDLAPHASAIAEALGLPARPADDPYVVVARFVTRYPVPAAFVRASFEFSTLSDVEHGGLIPESNGDTTAS